MAAAPRPDVEVDGAFTFRGLASTSQACQVILDYLNNRYNAYEPHICGGAYHITPCPTDADIKAFTPPRFGSDLLRDRAVQAFSSYGNGYCQAEPGPEYWAVWELCPGISVTWAMAHAGAPRADTSQAAHVSIHAHGHSVPKKVHA